MNKTKTALVIASILVMVVSLSFGITDINAFATTVTNLGTPDLSDSGNDSPEIASARLALRAINEADGEGADVSELVARYNNALALLRQPESSDLASCQSIDECKNSAEKMFISIAEDAVALKEQEKQHWYNDIILYEVYAIIGSFLVSFFGVHFYNVWRAQKLEQFLAMELREMHDLQHA